MIATLAGELEATFEAGRGVRTRSCGPLELRGPFAPSGTYYLRNVTAGMFAGDSFRVSVRCSEGARARVESPAAARVYSMPSRCAGYRTELRAESGSVLVWGPHATMLQTASSLRQETIVSVEHGATVVTAETLVMGRIAARERFDFTSYSSRLTVLGGDDAPAYRESFDLTPDSDLEAAMGGYGVLTCVYVLGEGQAWSAEVLDSVCAGESVVGWSELPNAAGFAVKGLSESLSEGVALARRCIDAVTPVLGL
jgi:urease accessory protein UreH